MKCENLQFNLSFYSDDVLTGNERVLTEAHLAQCPLCRQKLADFQSLRNDLRGLARPEIPNYLLSSVKRSVAAELKPVETKSSFVHSKSFRRWLELRFMPVSVGLVTSLLMTFVLLGTLLSDINQQQKTVVARVDTKYAPPVIVANSRSGSTTSVSSELPPGDYELKPEDFAAARISVSGESPSVNPAGALVALTKSLVRGKMKDDEVVIVADVFSNGLAQISRVIEPARDEQVMRELDRALKNDPDYAPFVPASFDNRADSVQIVLKIQRVDVVDNQPKSRRK